MLSPRDCVLKCYQEGRSIGDGFFIAGDQSDMAVEFCHIAISPQADAINLFPKGGCANFGEPSEAHNIGEFPLERNLNDANTRLFGASIKPVQIGNPSTRLHPWLCSLRTRGFRERHRCGVTLLSGN